MLVALFKDLSIPRHQFHCNIIPCPVVMSVTMVLTAILWWIHWTGWFAVSSDCIGGEKGTRGIPKWEVKSHLLSNQPFKTNPIHANNPFDAFHQVLGDITAFHKAMVTFTLVLTLSLRYTTDCHYRHTLSSSSRSIEPLLQNIFHVAAGFSDNGCVFSHELMHGYYWCVKAGGMFTCFRYDMSCMW